jgi:hypothetical protein
MQEPEGRDRRSDAMKDVTPSKPHQEQDGVEAKRPYSAPQLVRYGTIEEITAVKSGDAFDTVKSAP